MNQETLAWIITIFLFVLLYSLVKLQVLGLVLLIILFFIALTILIWGIYKLILTLLGIINLLKS